MIRILDESPILVGLGANLPSHAGPPRDTLTAAMQHLARAGLGIKACSSFWKTRPVPDSDQPWYVNATALIDEATAPPPARLLAILHEVEAAFGRTRSTVNAARSLDLDLLAYGSCLSEDPALTLPHPRLHERAFVLVPLAEIVPEWVHPANGLSVKTMIARLPAGQEILPDL